MASTYATYTPASGSNRTKWTFSAWIKLSSTSGSSTLFGSFTGNYAFIGFRSGTLTFQETYNSSETIKYRTTRVFRDTNAWYHIVVSYNTTSGVSQSDKIKMYVNGVRETSFGFTTMPSTTDYTSYMLNTYTHSLGANSHSGGSNHFDGLMSHVHLCDGYEYSASDFGETDSTTGEWKIKTDVSVSYGTNGFFVLKDGNSVTDQSGNSKNLSVAGGTLTKTEDCPSNVFNTMTALAQSTKVNLTNGSCTTVGNNNSGSGRCRSNWNIPSYGKWYFEYKMIPDNQGNTYPNSGIKYNAQNFYNPENSDSHADIFVYGTYSSELIHVNSGTNITAGAPASSGDIFGWCIDMDNGAIYIHQNGTYINSGNPTSGSSKTGAIFSFTPSDYPNMCVVSNEFGNSETQYNFGNGYFSSTAVSSAGTNASNNGIFEYDVPTGYTALSTKGLNE